MKRSLRFLALGMVATLVAIAAGVIASNDELALTTANDVARVVYVVAFLVAVVCLIVFLAIVVSDL